MAGSLFILPRVTPLNGSVGVPLSKLTFSRTGTSTAQNTYSDSALTTPNANPVVADANGVFGKIYLDPSLGFNYRVKWSTSADVQLWQEDDVSPGITEATATITFTPTWAGFSPVPTGAVSYYLIGSLAVIQFGANCTGTSNATSFSITNVPPSLRPIASTNPIVPYFPAIDAGAVCAATLRKSGTSTWEFFKGTAPPSLTGWTNSGTKGFEPGTILIFPTV